MSLNILSRAFPPNISWCFQVYCVKTSHLAFLTLKLLLQQSYGSPVWPDTLESFQDRISLHEKAAACTAIPMQFLYSPERCARDMQLPAGADICEAGDIADCLWMLHEGSVSAVGATGYETKVSTAPALLGETALLQELDGQYHFRPCALRSGFML